MDGSYFIGGYKQMFGNTTHNHHYGADHVTAPEYQEFVKRIGDERSRINKRLEKLEDTYAQLAEINVNVKNMAENLINMTGELKKTSDRIARLEDSAITSSQLNGFGKRIDDLEKKVSDGFEKTDLRLDAIEKAPGHSATQKLDGYKEWIIKTAGAVIIVALTIALCNAILPHLAFK